MWLELNLGFSIYYLCDIWQVTCISLISSVKWGLHCRYNRITVRIKWDNIYKKLSKCCASLVYKKMFVVITVIVLSQFLSLWVPQEFVSTLLFSRCLGPGPTPSIIAGSKKSLIKYSVNIFFFFSYFFFPIHLGWGVLGFKSSLKILLEINRKILMYLTE